MSRGVLLKILGLRQRTRRRLVLGYWAAVLALIAAMAIVFEQHRAWAGDLHLFWLFWAITTVPMLLDNLRPSLTRGKNLQPLLKPAPLDRVGKDRPMDERDAYMAFRSEAFSNVALRGFVLVSVLFLLIVESGWCTYLRVPLLWLLYFVTVSLPNTFLLWREKDMEPADEEPLS